jgi:hypothetical protein
LRLLVRRLIARLVIGGQQRRQRVGVVNLGLHSFGPRHHFVPRVRFFAQRCD